MNTSTKTALAVLGGGTLLYLALRKTTEKEVSPVEAFSCATSKPPTPHPQPPAGYRRATALPPGAVAAANQALKLTKNVGESLVIETFPDLLFFSEWHCSNDRGWHRGVSVFERIS
jgi:hypothetical protein